VIQTTARLFEGSFAAKGLKLELRLPPDLPPIHGHADELQEILVNLLENAREALTSGQTAWVCAQSGPEGIVLAVEDNGPGLGPDPEKLFDPFYTTKTTGTGLGLAIVRKICAAHHARLEASNRPPEEGGGARFRICFPNPEQGASP